MKKLLASFTLAAASLVSIAPTAHAATTSIVFTNPLGSFSSASETDTFSFSVSESSYFGAIGGIATFTVSALNDAFAGVFESATLSFGSTVVASGNVNPGGQSFSLSAALTSPGTYTLSVTGSPTGTLGTAYYSVTGSVSPVPEPESYAMMLAGLAVMGAIARKRNQNKV